MILYHGTTVKIKNPEIKTSEIGRDFGFAFYTTEIKEQAERWAIRRAMILSRKNRSQVMPIVIQGIMRKEDAVQRLRFEKINNQIAFCTEKALSTLKFVESYTVEG